MANDVRLGRKPTLTHQQREAIKRRDAGNETLGEIARSYNVDSLDDFEVGGMTKLQRRYFPVYKCRLGYRSAYF